MKFELKDLVIQAVLLVIIGGILSTLLSPIFGGLTGLFAGLSLLVPVILIVYIVNNFKGKIESENFVYFIVLLALMSAIGSILVAVIPFAGLSSLILSVDNFTLAGLVWTLMYIVLAQAIAKKIGY